MNALNNALASTARWLAGAGLALIAAASLPSQAYAQRADDSYKGPPPTGGFQGQIRGERPTGAPPARPAPAAGHSFRAAR